MSKSSGRTFFLRPQDMIGIAILAFILLVVLPLALDNFRLQFVGKYLTYAFVALGLVLCWGYAGILSLGQGVFFGLGGYCMAMFLKLEASSVENTKIQTTPGIRTLWTESDHRPALVLGAFQELHLFHRRRRAGAGLLRPHPRLRFVQAACGRRVFRHHHPGARCDHDHPDHRPAGLYRRH